MVSITAVAGLRFASSSERSVPCAHPARLFEYWPSIVPSNVYFESIRFAGQMNHHAVHLTIRNRVHEVPYSVPRPFDHFVSIEFRRDCTFVVLLYVNAD